MRGYSSFLARVAAAVAEDDATFKLRSNDVLTSFTTKDVDVYSNKRTTVTKSPSNTEAVPNNR